ncbi:MAG: 4Fe-4S dicluster domain-containing protein [Planctomycetota bacterium]|jgi:molybdopterin-containing oxidoreductase family iron-sulfur binding subunit
MNEIVETPDVATEPAAGSGSGLPRRDFLVFVGAGIAAAGLSQVRFRAPEHRIVPLLDQPDELSPGVPAWYASTCGGCPAGCGVLVKNRDGRPIKMEGNPDHPLSGGGLCARGQATVLDLYDADRLREPVLRGGAGSWDSVDSAVAEGLAAARAAGTSVRILAPTVSSPSLRAAADALLAGAGDAGLVTWDVLGASALLAAQAETRGERRLPWYRFDKARVIVSFDADFLGTWISPVEFARDWGLHRRMDAKKTFLSWHVQFEPRPSVTGAASDLRVPLTPSRMRAAVVEFARLVGERVGSPLGTRLPDAPEPSGVDEEVLRRVADRLAAQRGRSLVVSGSSDVSEQVAVDVINRMLGNHGETVDLALPSLQLQGDDGEVSALMDEMAAGSVGALIVLDSDPVHGHPRGAEFEALMAKVPFVVSVGTRNDATAAKAHVVAPDHHALEGWGDAHPHVGVYAVRQPVIAPLWNTRSAMESLLTWAGKPAKAYDWIRETWRRDVMPLQTAHADFETMWDTTVHDGLLLADGERLDVPPFDDGAAERVKPAAATASQGLEFVAYASVAIGDGRMASNPWLQEVPDPITRIAWGNVALLSAATAKSLGVADGRMVALEAGGVSVELPAQVQPGMADGVVAAAIGYGRADIAGTAANLPIVKMLPVERDDPGGANVAPLLGKRVTVSPQDRTVAPAMTQTTHHQVVPFTGQDRGIAKNVGVEALQEAPEGEEHGEKAGHGPSLWPGHEYPGHHWAMAVDLNACMGCTACVVACQAENNVPVVGRAEVRKGREMHWIRIDRYYEGAASDDIADPDITFQPMLCQQCDNAPCETVCPALATMHSDEGLNVQAYNRCVGTRYCANNCPYKVRRFNWFDYGHDDEVQNMVLNPDVTVRSRGIMEKCTFCVQRIAEGKRDAKAEGREPRDGDILPACAQTCPTGAITFGDSNDPNSEVSRRSGGPRSYRALEEVGVDPSIHYLSRVRRPEGEEV